jgi:hypothetical protein
MNAVSPLPIALHEDVALFREALRFTAAVPDTGPVDVTKARLGALRQQLDSQLKPVLRSRDFNRFVLDRAFDVVRAVGQNLH